MQKPLMSYERMRRYNPIQ